ncbi:hypothetical protein TSAR_000752 [Trichomalopsis sarcophagae]|uniref:Uncharacterized protein n=1 Tax=Trichomalopsis sarcophagae TaxID=543379 RepID=A0A232F5R4_9HYME|nr:hypothetical protein TSAR_000752 [Trichomalopsis sarcophagae]
MPKSNHLRSMELETALRAYQRICTRLQQCEEGRSEQYRRNTRMYIYVCIWMILRIWRPYTYVRVCFFSFWGNGWRWRGWRRLFGMYISVEDMTFPFLPSCFLFFFFSQLYLVKKILQRLYFV